MNGKMNVLAFSRVIVSGAFWLYMATSCSNDCSRNPQTMLGHWKSLQGRPDVTIARDSANYYAIVHHRITNGKQCPVRYPVVCTATNTYIQAASRILLTYSTKNKILFLSPGGKYCLLVSE